MAQCGVAPRAAAAAVLPTPRVASRGVDGGKARAPPRRLRAFGRTARDAFPRVFQPGTGRQRQRGAIPSQGRKELHSLPRQPEDSSSLLYAREEAFLPLEIVSAALRRPVRGRAVPAHTTARRGKEEDKRPLTVPRALCLLQDGRAAAVLARGTTS